MREWRLEWSKQAIAKSAKTLLPFTKPLHRFHFRRLPETCNSNICEYVSAHCAVQDGVRLASRAFKNLEPQ